MLRKLLLPICLFVMILYAGGGFASSQDISNDKYSFNYIDLQFTAADGPAEVNTNLVSFINKNNELAVFSVQTGELVWQTKLPGEFSDLYNLSVSSNKNMVFCTWGNAVYALTLKDGKIIWKKELSSIVRTKPLVYDNSVIVSSIDENLIALSVKDGADLWNKNSALVEIKKVRSISPVVSKSGEIVTILSKNILYVFNKLGGEVFSKVLHNFEPLFSPLLHKDMIILSNDLGGIDAYSISSREKIWSLDAYPYNEPILLKNGLLFVQGKNELLLINSETGKILHKYTLTELASSGIRKEDAILFSTVLGDSFIVLLSRNAFFTLDRNLQNPSSTHTLPFRGKVVAATSVGECIYIKMLGGSVFCLSTGNF